MNKLEQKHLDIIIYIMKNILIILITLCLFACNTPVVTTENNSPAPSSNTKVEKVIDEIYHHGLYKVQLNDSTTILIYRGVESVSMIQLK